MNAPFLRLRMREGLRIAPLECAVAVLLAGLVGCGPVRVATLSVPEGKTTAEQQMDEVECSEYSKPGYVPLLFGAGIAIQRKITRGRYSDCMESKGYVVDR